MNAATLNQGKQQGPYLFLGMCLALVLALVAYLTSPVSRGLAMLVLAMLPLVGLFVIPARQVMVIAVVAAGALLICALGLWRLEPQHYVWSDDGIAAFMTACMILSVGFMTRNLNARQSSQRQHQLALKETLENMQKQATKDLQTGLPNQAYMREWMRQAAKRAQRSGQPLALALMARDQAKPMHAAPAAQQDGTSEPVRDELAFDQWVTCANRVFRENDVTARWSSEELLVLFEGSPPDLAREGLTRLRREAECVAFSSGLLMWHPEESIDSAIHRAREALQKAQAQGGQRDEVVG